MVTAQPQSRGLPTASLPRAAGNAEQLKAQGRFENLSLSSLAAPGFALILVIVLVPIAWLFWLSVRDAKGFTAAHYLRLLHPSYLLTLQTTFELSFLVTGICILIGYPLAYVIAQAKGRMAAILLMLVMFPIWTSLLVRCYAWLVLLQRRGLVNNWLTDLGLIERLVLLLWLLRRSRSETDLDLRILGVRRARRCRDRGTGQAWAAARLALMAARPCSSSAVAGQPKPRRKWARGCSNQWPGPTNVPWLVVSTS